MVFMLYSSVNLLLSFIVASSEMDDQYVIIGVTL